jgi:hypothetical protein
MESSSAEPESERLTAIAHAGTAVGARIRVSPI